MSEYTEYNEEEQAQPAKIAKNELTPRQIVAELDKHIVGQEEAKRSVAVVVRNRYRRRQLEQKMQDEILPKNIIMIGPTGVGKTEIARRLAKLVDAPFIKVEATKFTEVGYVGRDVESIIRDLVETSIRLVKAEKVAKVEEQAAKAAELRILDMLQPLHRGSRGAALGNIFGGPINEPREEPSEEARVKEDEVRRRRVWLRDQLSRGNLDNEMVEIEVEEAAPQFTGAETMGIDMSAILGNIMPKKTKKRRVNIAEARRIITQEEANKLVDNDEVNSLGVQRAEQSGIVFLDELDKIASSGDGGHGPDVSRGGVQRDILPIVEGCTVQTKYGPVKSDYVLFIAAGAFTMSKPSDLIPELQGRFPIRVNLNNLTRDDLRRILLEPEHSLVEQYLALLAVDGVNAEFTEDGIDTLAEIADLVNRNTENIGARRLHTILEKVLEDLLFDAPEAATGEIRIDRAYIENKLADIAIDQDLSRFIL
jgi:ATP-dependent HslUV protease ATP-binding subunit HslU